MATTRLTRITVTLQWFYDAQTDELSFGWSVIDLETGEELATGAAPGRHLYDLEEQAVAAADRLAQVTRSIAGAEHR